ncbi:MAG: RNA 3'-terminal phosphate cyclase [Haloarculaceae archaeon]
MHEVDGSDGGGQLLRTSLAVALVTGESVRVENVRGSRPEPGLRPQHVTALELAAAVSDATVEGATAGSETVVFEPEALCGGQYAVDVGTAGSVTLVFDTVLPAALALDEPIRIEARGGTHVAWSPPVTTYERVKLPLLRRFGLQAALECDRPGFYPVGGGTATLTLAPSTPAPIRLADRGAMAGVRVHSLASESLADADVAERQATAAVSELESDGYDVLERSVTYAASDCPGSAITVTADYRHSVAGFDALGERGKPAEAVATEAVDQIREFDADEAAIDPHLADQLLVVLAFAGGAVRIPSATDHVTTSLDLLADLGVPLRTERGDGTVLVERPT